MFPFHSSRQGRQFSVSDSLPFVETPPGEKAVELHSLEIQVFVSGLHAETTQTMRFHNPNRQNLEGFLTFPLPDGAVVCGYALDIAGQMVDGVVVPKQEARRILEAEERKGIDPGTVEQVRGNVYRTRIYPIPARGARTVRITYVSELTVQGVDAAYHLPLSHAGHIEQVSLRVEVVQAPVEPAVSGGIGNLSLNRWEDRWVGEATLGKGTPSEDLQLRLPSLPEHFTVVEKTADNETFFYISSKLPEPSDDDRSPWTARRIAVAWDASGSRVDLERDFAFMKELFSCWPQVTVDVLVFRNRVEKEAKSFSIGDDQLDALFDYLRQLPYDGGTNLAALDLSSLPHADDEAWFLFSDGMGTVESGLPACAGVSVFTIASQADSHGAFLKHIADKSGGAYLNLLRTPAKAACEAIRWNRTSLQLAKATGCESVHISSYNGRLAITGRLLAEVGSVKLSGPGAPSGSLAVKRDSAHTGGVVARAWAGQEAATLALVADENSEGLCALGRQYGLVTPGTSLLVLENLEQYLEYDIEPPATLPEMLEAYRRRKAELFEEEKNRKKEQIEIVLGWWQDRIEWWENDFQADLEKANKKKEAKMMTREKVLVSPFDDDLTDEWPMESEESEMSMEFLDSESSIVSEQRMSYDVYSVGGQAAPTVIRIKPWSPDTPYLTAMKEADADRVYAVYLQQRRDYAGSPAFYLDCGDYLLTHEQPEYGVRVLSNLVELGLDDAALMRIYAWRLQQAGELDMAVSELEKVGAQRDDEPQSHRDLALALEQRWERDHNSEDAVRAMELLYDVVLRQWDRFPEIEVIALMELNRLIHLAGQAAIPIPERIDSRLRRHLDLDVRISMSWDADLTDVDLHVFEPLGGHAYYAHNLTAIGGLVSRDFRDGYGPEEYVLRKAVPGVYTVKAHYYASDQQTLCGPCTVIVNVFTNYGRENEQKQVLTLRLDQPSDEVLVGKITIGREQIESDLSSGGKDWQQAFLQLRLDMTLKQIIATVGQPAEIQGEEKMILVYRPLSDVVIHVLAAPKLIAVQQIMDGATLNLL